MSLEELAQRRKTVSALYAKFFAGELFPTGDLPEIGEEDLQPIPKTEEAIAIISRVEPELEVIDSEVSKFVAHQDTEIEKLQSEIQNFSFESR